MSDRTYHDIYKIYRHKSLTEEEKKSELVMKKLAAENPCLVDHALTRLKSLDKADYTATIGYYYIDESSPYKSKSVVLFDITDGDGNIVRACKKFSTVPKSLDFNIGTKIKVSLRKIALSYPSDPRILEYNIYGEYNYNKNVLTKANYTTVTGRANITYDGVLEYYSLLIKNSDDGKLSYKEAIKKCRGKNNGQVT